jgi:hypothetical protein
MHNGSATRKTTTEARRSCENGLEEGEASDEADEADVCEVFELCDIKPSIAVSEGREVKSREYRDLVRSPYWPFVGRGLKYPRAGRIGGRMVHFKVPAGLVGRPWARSEPKS